MLFEQKYTNLIKNLFKIQTVIVNSGLVKLFRKINKYLFVKTYRQ